MTNLSIEAKAKGKFRLQKVNPLTGEVTFDSGEFDNNLLNNFFVTSVSLFVCLVGTDSTVSNSDTTLTSLGNTSGRVTTTNYSVDAAGVVSFDYVNTYTFTAGAIVGNMSCIGLSASATLTGNNLKIKSLIKDLNGDPTTIPATAGDQIVVTHTLNVKWNQYQSLGTFIVDGVTYQADFYDVHVANTVGAAGTTIYGYLGLNDHQNMGTGGSCYPLLVTGFTPPSIPTLVSSYIPFNTGRLYPGVLTIQTQAYDSSAGTMKSSFSFPLAANSNMAANAPIAAVGFSPESSATSVLMAVAFTPALPKNTSIAYTFTLTLTMTRA